MSNYDEIEYILKQEKIKSMSDVLKLDISQGRISEKQYPWINDICVLLEKNLFNENRKMIDSSDKEIIIDNLISDKDIELLKYTIFFPEKTILSAGDILIIDNERTIDKKFLYNFFNGRKLIKNNLVSFCASATYYECRGGLEGLCIDKYCEDKLISVSHLYNDYSVQNNIFLQLPWLYNIDMDNFIHIINENKVEFQNYSLYLSRLWKYANGEDLIKEEYLYEIKEFILHMQIVLEKSKSKIRTKTSTIVLGMCFTIIPYIIAQKYNFDITLLSAILGGSTLRELVDIPAEVKEMSNYNKEHPLWVVWKLFNS